MGREPLDICVDSPRTKVVSSAEAAVVSGDHWGRPGEEVAYGKMRGQSAVGTGLDVFGREKLDEV